MSDINSAESDLEFRESGIDFRKMLADCTSEALLEIVEGDMEEAASYVKEAIHSECPEPWHWHMVQGHLAAALAAALLLEQRHIALALAEEEK